ncbi:MAG: endonuclease, partial [Roseibacillus sp.]|nr:endonuclease [Roseibacillus sp.]
ITTTSTLPAVILGDFNATVWSPHLREFIKTTSLMDSGRKRGFQPTWRWFNPFFSIPIDHVFHNAALSCTNRQIGPALGSDHRPVITEFALTP